MDNKSTKKQKTARIIEIVLLSFFAIGVLGMVIAQFAAPTSAISVWVKENVIDLNKIGASFMEHLPVLIKSVISIVAVYAAIRILRIILGTLAQKSNRTKTVFTLIDGFIKYGGGLIIIMLVLHACGVDTTALLASVGVLTLIVGLGAQSLIADIIAGMFIIFENEYNVGEIISVDGFRGTVTEIGIRSTKITDYAGNIKIINNSNIGDIVNLSREPSIAVADCDFPYNVPIELIENMIADNIETFQQKIPAIMEGPFYKGVCAYKDSNVTIKLLAKCSEEDRFQVERDILRVYRMLLSEKGIDIAFPQVVINYPDDKKFTVTQKQKKKAQAFSDDQREASEDLEEQEI